MSVTLAIETSNPSAAGPGQPGVAVRAGSTIVVEPVGAGREDDLMPAIERLFARVGIGPREIALIAVSIGPGGFTALRVSITVAKALAYSCGAACIAVPTAAALAAGARHAGLSGRIGVLLACKGETSFASVFEDGSQEACESRLIDAS